MIPVLATLLFVKPSTQATLARSWDSTLVVGHRGAAAYQPENTIPAFEAGIASGADAVECDVHLSQDREMVVMHDPTLDRTTPLKGRIAETPWATMKAAGVPSLPELTRTTKDRTILVVEIKEGEGIEPMVVDHLRKERLEDQSIVFSFHDERLAKVEALAPELTSVWLVGKKVDPANLAPVFDRLREIKGDGLGVDYRNCPPELAAEARRRKIPLFVWTVPPGPEVDRLKALRVNAIITNHPRDVCKQLKGE